MFLSSYHPEIFISYYYRQTWCSCKRSRSEVNGQGHRVNTQFSRFRTITPVWIHIWWWNDAQSLMLLRRGALYFSRSSVIFQGHTTKEKTLFWTQIGIFRTVNPVWINDGYEIIHKTWSTIGEVPYSFSRSSVKFQGQRGQKITDFDPNRAFPDCNASMNSPMALKWCTKLNVVKKRCPIVFQGRPSNFKVTGNKKSQILTRIGRFRTVTPV